MTQSFSDMLYLFSCAAHGVQPEKKTDLNLDEIYHKAASQGVLPLVLISFKELYMNDGVIICGTPLEEHIKRLRLQALNNIQRGFIIHNAIKKLADNGISCCILKGETVAILYHNPDCRISNDTDIYIDTDDKETIVEAQKILEESGFKFCKGLPESHHINATHKTAGYLELHHSLHDKLYKDIWFDNKTSLSELFRMVKTPIGIEVPALGVTDALYYSFLHLVKHFLRDGIGIRPFMDILLYIKNYKNEIDFEKFSGLIRYLKYDKFFDNIMCVGVKYLGFAKDELYPFSNNDELIERILTDVENGGQFGKDEVWRKNFHKVYSKQRFSRFTDEDYHKKIKAYMTRNPFKRFFLNRSIMMNGYTYVARHGFLLPVAWLHRASKFVRKLFLTNKVKERLDLVRKLDMI